MQKLLVFSLILAKWRQINLIAYENDPTMSQVSNEVHFRLQIVSTSQGKLMILACFIGQTVRQVQ